MTYDPSRILWIAAAAPKDAPAAWAVETSFSGAGGIERLRNSCFDAVLIDAPVAEWRPEELLEELARARPGVPLLVHDEQALVTDAVRYMRLGAHDVAGPGDDLFALIEAAFELSRSRRLAKPAVASRLERRVRPHFATRLHRTGRQTTLR